MGKEKLVFVDHTFHIKSRSGDFLRKIFKQHYKIINIWVDKKLNFDKKIYDHENIFFFQIFPPLRVLNKLKNKNLMWAPMYDSPHYPIGFSPLIWRIVKLYNLKVLSFSKKISNQIKNLNINYLDLKFFIKPKNITHKKNKRLNIFFWYRGYIDINDWIKFFDLKRINRITYFDTEPKRNKMSLLKNKKIEYLKSNFIKNKNNFLKLIKKSDVFICPRNKEGIGMAQVEALSMGKYLIGYDEATMNDYIKNSKIGFLFNKNTKKKVIFKNIFKYKNYRLNYAKRGYQKFDDDKKKIIKLFKKNIKKKEHPLKFIYVLFLLKIYTVKRKIFMLLN